MDEAETAWKRTLGVSAIAQAFSILGFNFVTPFLPLYVQRLGIHGVGQVTLWAAILSGGAAIFMAVASPIWGVLSDRHGRKIMVVRAMLSASVAIGLMGLAQNVYQLLFLRMVQGAFSGTMSATQALVASQTPQERLGFSLGVIQTSVFVGISVGPFAGGLVADSFGFRQSFFFAGALLFIGGLIVAFFIKEDPRPFQTDTGARPAMLRGMLSTLWSPALAPMIGAIFAVQFAITSVLPILPQFIQYLQGAADHAATVTGFVLAGAGLAGAISSILAGYLSDRIGSRLVLVGSAFTAATLSVPQAFVTATWQIAVLRILIGFAVGALLASASALLASLVAPEKRGTAYGLQASANALGFGAGPLAAAGMVALSGMRAVFIMAAILLAFIGIWTAVAVKVPKVEAYVDVQPVGQGGRTARSG